MDLSQKTENPVAFFTCTEEQVLIPERSVRCARLLSQDDEILHSLIISVV